MATAVWANPLFPAPIDEKRFARNTSLPHTTAIRRIAANFNSVASYRGRHFMTRSYEDTQTPAGALGATIDIYWVFRTGENTKKVVFWVGVAPCDVSNSAEPYVQLAVTDGTSTFTKKVYHSIVDTSGRYFHDQIYWAKVEFTDDDGILDDTNYRLTVTRFNYARLHSISGYTVGKTVSISGTDGVCDELAYEEQDPIYAADIQDILETGTKLWQHNATQLIGWGQESNAAPMEVGTTWENIVSGSTAGWSAASPGWQLDTQYHDASGDGGDIPVLVLIYANRSSGAPGSTLDVRLVDSSGAVFTETGITEAEATTSPCHSFTATIPASTVLKYDIECQCSAGAWEIYAISIIEYEA